MASGGTKIASQSNLTPSFHPTSWGGREKECSMCTCVRVSVFECMCVCVYAGFPNELFPTGSLSMWLLKPEGPERHHSPLHYSMGSL